MASKRESIRAVIYSCYKNGAEVSAAYTTLQNTFGTSAPTLKTIYNWYNRFAAGQQQFEDAPKSRRKITKTTAQNVEKVRQFVTDNPRCTYKQIEHATKLSSGTVNEILTRKLKYRKLCARWIPHSLTNEQKQARVKNAP